MPISRHLNLAKCLHVHPIVLCAYCVRLFTGFIYSPTQCSVFALRC